MDPQRTSSDVKMGYAQGENLSPFLFPLFLNDITEFFNDRNFDGITCV